MSGRLLTAYAPDGVPEVVAGDDLVALLLAALGDEWVLADGDVVCVTSKAVSKAEGRVAVGDRDSALPGETQRVVARRGRTTIVRNRLGLTMAAAGIDASNVAPGHVVLLPVDPDASARGLRHDFAAHAGVSVAVVVTDTSGRAWREGQTDIAIGAAGLVVLDDHRGRVDPHGHELAVTAPAVADEAAGAAELVQGKLGGRPFAVLRGLGDHVLPPDDDGPGAAALVRPEAGDLFGYGAREAVVRALADDAGPAGFGSPASHEELLELLVEVLGTASRVDAVGATDPADTVVTVRPPDARVPVLARACGWTVAESRVDQTLRPVVP
jgi:coenzyme F420-0:L-glutamate ligase/coenzyme F420-1:gamma-L-glutamate ligase